MHANKSHAAVSKMGVSPVRVSRDTPRSSPSTAPVVEEFELVETHYLQPPKLTRQSGVMLSRSDDEEKEEKKEEKRPAFKLLGRPLTGTTGRPIHFSTVLNFGGDFTANTVAAKYLLRLAGSTQLKVDQVSSAGEWSSFNAVFEEFFCSKMVIRFKPVNRYLGYVGGSLSNLCTSLVTLAGYQHDQGAVTDAASNYYQMLNSSQSATFDLADPWKFEWKNIEKFSWGAPANNVAGSQGWMNISDVSNYGGYVSASTPWPSAAGASASAWNNGVTFGNITIEFHMHFRYRD